jgi:signal transduction histidine kinase
MSNACRHGRGHPIEVAVGATGDMAFVQVRDHGAGIAPDQQAARKGGGERSRQNALTQPMTRQDSPA